MKKIILTLASLFVFNFVHAAVMPENTFGVGLMIGSQTAVTGKYWLSSANAIDFGVGLGGRNRSSVYGDYLWHVSDLFGNRTEFAREASGYFGAGVGLDFWSDSYECGRWNCSKRTENSGTGVFLRGLFGFEWVPPTTRFGLFAEIGPTLLIAPSTYTSLDISLGCRYYF